jgi:hypothetical protein
MRDKETGAYMTQDILGRTRRFANDDELRKAGFAGGDKPAQSAPQDKPRMAAPQDNPKIKEWEASLASASESRLREIMKQSSRTSPEYIAAKRLLDSKNQGGDINDVINSQFNLGQ